MFFFFFFLDYLEFLFSQSASLGPLSFKNKCTHICIWVFMSVYILVYYTLIHILNNESESPFFSLKQFCSLSFSEEHKPGNHQPQVWPFCQHPLLHGQHGPPCHLHPSLPTWKPSFLPHCRFFPFPFVSPYAFFCPLDILVSSVRMCNVSERTWRFLQPSLPS